MKTEQKIGVYTVKKLPNYSHKHYDNIAAIDLLHQLSILYTGTKRPHDYGTGEEYTYVEAHLIKKIADHPGITVTELAYEYAKTKGALSQVVKKLIEKNLLYRKAVSSAGNTFALYVTAKGVALNDAHLAYDLKHAGETLDEVRKIHTQEEIDIAFSVIEDWLSCRRKVHKRRTESP